MKKAKVCQVSSVHFALDTRIFFRFAQSLKSDCDVSVIGVHDKVEVIDGIDIIPFKRFKNKMLRICVTWFLILEKCLKQKADIYQIHDPELMPTALILRAMGKKVVYDVHENIAEDIFDKPWIKHQKLLYGIFNFFEKKVARYCPIFITEDSYLPRYKGLGAKVDIVHNYPSQDFFNPYIVENRPGEIRLFYSGILLFSRSIMEIIKAMHLLQQKGFFVHFDVVGELYTEMDYSIDELPYIAALKPYLHFYGRLPLNEAYEISKKASLGMSLIHPMKNSMESYPTKMFEYMSVGLPQIASNFPLYQSVVEKHNAGLCCDPTSAIDIATAIEKYVANPDLIKQHGKNALESAHNYSWNTELAKVKTTYKNLLKD